MVGRFNDNFVSADAVHLVEHAFGLLVEVAFDAERREFVRDYSNCPAGSVFLRSAAVGVGAVGKDFRRRLAFIAVAEGTEATFDLDGLAHEVGRALGAVGRNDYPSAYDGVFS